jgi:hypothetical protein
MRNVRNEYIIFEHVESVEMTLDQDDHKLRKRKDENLGFVWGESVSILLPRDVATTPS